jgi:hypothetical protein
MNVRDQDQLQRQHRLVKTLAERIHQVEGVPTLLRELKWIGRRDRRLLVGRSVLLTIEAYDHLMPKGYDHIMPASIVT